MRVLIPVLLLVIGCASYPHGWVRRTVCGNCPTNTLDRGDKGMVCQDERGTWQQCGGRTTVLVPMNPNRPPCPPCEDGGRPRSQP